MKILWQSRLQNRLRDIGENVLIKGDRAFYAGDNDEQKQMKLREFSLASGALLAVGGFWACISAPLRLAVQSAKRRKNGCSFSTSCYLRWH